MRTSTEWAMDLLAEWGVDMVSDEEGGEEYRADDLETAIGFVDDVRDEALEEAAKVAKAMCAPTDLVRAIRALKEGK